MASDRIINMASVAGKRGTARRGAYTASKFGVIGLIQALAQELAAHGITVNAICPGSVDTPSGGCSLDFVAGGACALGG